MIFYLNTSAPPTPSRVSNVTEFENVVLVPDQDHQQSKRQKTNSERQRIVFRECRMLLRRNGSKQYLLHSTPLLPQQNHNCSKAMSLARQTNWLYRIRGRRSQNHSKIF